MRFPDQFLDEVRQRQPIADVVGRRVKLIKRGREHSGLCPFHSEKTPSFTVSEDKGFYHCFGCGAHGDVFKFVCETENLSFPEAVERLALEAGMTLPQVSAEDVERDQQRKGLFELMETAAAWFESRLGAGGGEAARAYVEKRGLSQDTVRKFRLGLGPDHRSLIREALGARGFTDEQMIETGLLIKPDEGEPYARFRDRLMFPISDPQGRIVGFGGRALGEARAKYLNSPETPLFHKGRLLYNLRDARAKARQADRLIVVEGYMDVIALSQAGFEESVAPLGTAVTEEQIQLLWRITPEPILCFDGDSAGARAAERAALRAMPSLRPGQSLRFALLPSGEDPDSLIANQGRGAMRKVLEDARTLIDLLWEIEVNRQPADTPERRAGLRSRLFELCAPIGDETVRKFYRDEFARRFDAAFARQRPGGAQRRQRRTGPTDFRPAVSPELKRTMLAQSAMPPSAERDRRILKTLLAHPVLLDELEEDIAGLDIHEADMADLRDGLIRAVARSGGGAAGLTPDSLDQHLRDEGHGTALAKLSTMTGGPAFTRRSVSLEEARRGLETLMLPGARERLESEIERVSRLTTEVDDPRHFETLKHLRAELERLERLEPEE